MPFYWTSPDEDIARAEYRQLANRVRAASLRRQRSPWRRLYRRLGFASRVVIFALVLGMIVVGIMSL